MIKEEAIEIVKKDGREYKNLMEFREDKDVVKEAISQSPEMFKYIPDGLREDEDIVKIAVELDGNNLRYVGDKIKQDNFEISMIAMQQNPDAIQYASSDAMEVYLDDSKNITEDFKLSSVYNAEKYAKEKSVELRNSRYESISLYRSFEKWEKLHSPYCQVAKNALMKWNDFSEKKAKDFVLNNSLLEIESEIGAKKSMELGTETFCEQTDKGVWLKHVMYDLDRDKDYDGGMVYSYIERFQDELNNLPEDKKNNIIIDSLSNIHNGWVEDNASKFMKREKNINIYQ